MRKFRCALGLVALTTPIAAHAVVLPELTNIANKITIAPHSLGLIQFGEEFNVTLGLPAELGGNAVLPRGAGRPTVVGAISGRPVDRVESGRSDPTRPLPVGPLAPIRAPDRSIPPLTQMPGVAYVIPCQLLPGGCPDPIPLPPDPANPTGPAATLSNFAVHIEWRVAAVKGGQRIPVDRANYVSDYESPARQLSPSFVLAPLHVVDFTGVNPPADAYEVEATVTLTANKTVLTVPPEITPASSDAVTRLVPLSMQPLQVPTVFLLMLHPLPDNASGGATAIYFPQGSQLSEAALRNAAQLFDTYNQLNSRLGFVTWFGSYVAGLGALGDALKAPHVSIKERKFFENDLNEDDFIHRSWYTSVNDTEVENESSALVLLGPPCTGAQFWQNDHYKGKTFRVRTDAAMTAIIRNFKDMKTEPQSAFLEGENTYGTSANDSLSSFKWQLRSPETLQLLEEAGDVCTKLPFSYP